MVASSIPRIAREPVLDPLTINSSVASHMDIILDQLNVDSLNVKVYQQFFVFLKEKMRDQPQIMQFRPWASDEHEFSRCNLGNGDLSINTAPGCQHVTDISHAYLCSSKCDKMTSHTNIHLTEHNVFQKLMFFF